MHSKIVLFVLLSFGSYLESKPPRKIVTFAPMLPELSTSTDVNAPVSQALIPGRPIHIPILRKPVPTIRKATCLVYRFGKSTAYCVKCNNEISMRLFNQHIQEHVHRD